MAIVLEGGYEESSVDGTWLCEPGDWVVHPRWHFHANRFSGPKALCSWVGLTPKHRESDTKAWRGRATKQGSRLVRWAAVEAISKMRGGPKSSSSMSLGSRPAALASSPTNDCTANACGMFDTERNQPILA